MSIDTEKLMPIAEEATRLLKALAHPARLIICCHLKDQEHSVGDIEAALGIKQPRLSRELAKLREEGFLTTRRESKVIFYRLVDEPRQKLLIEKICAVMLGTAKAGIGTAKADMGAAPLEAAKAKLSADLPADIATEMPVPRAIEARPRQRPQRRGGYGVFARTED